MHPIPDGPCGCGGIDEVEYVVTPFPSNQGPAAQGIAVIVRRLEMFNMTRRRPASSDECLRTIVDRHGPYMAPLRAHHPRDLTKGLGGIEHVLEHVLGYDYIERFVRIGEVLK